MLYSVGQKIRLRSSCEDYNVAVLTIQRIRDCIFYKQYECIDENNNNKLHRVEVGFPMELVEE